MERKLLAVVFGSLALANISLPAHASEPMGCIISQQSGEKYCLKAGERSGYSLPNWIYAHPVDVLAPSGVSVMLSDWDNLSYNRLAVFDSYTSNEQLKNVKAYNGRYLDFSKPRSMRVLASEQYPEACIVSLENDERYCLKEGQRSGYSLPEYIKGHEVEVRAPEGLGVMLSDWDNLSYNRLAVFGGYKSNAQLESVKAYNGEILDFSNPRSMRVLAYTEPDKKIETELKWSWQGSSFKPESDQVMVTPVTAQLNDDNGDGRIDNQDVADVIVVTFEGRNYSSGGLVRALSGVDGSELWSYNNGGVIADARYSPAVADLDHDGVVEIVTTSTGSDFIKVLDNHGNVKKQIATIESGWRTVGDIALADLDGDGDIEILSADGVYDYQSGQLVFSHTWSPASISGDFDGDNRQEVFADGTLFQSSGAVDWQYTAADKVWFSSLVNLDSDKNPELVVSVPASYSSAQNSSLAVLEHDGSTKWEITNENNPGGGVQAVSSFLAAYSESVTQQSEVFGYEKGNVESAQVGNDNLLYVRSGAAIDAIGTDAHNTIGGNGGALRDPIDLSNVTAIDVTYGKYFWGGRHLLAMEFSLKNGSSVMVGSKNYGYHLQTKRFVLPEGESVTGVNVWSQGWLVEGVQFETATTAGTDSIGIVYAGYKAVDMYNAKGELVWSVENDDIGSGKIGVSAYDFDADGIDEVLVQDHFKVRILDGQTGKELAVIDNSTGTLWEYPIVVDLEGDNNAEMIVVANNYDSKYSINKGVYVYQSAQDDKPWTNATRIWNQHSFNLTNITQAGQIPETYQPSWLSHNTYRSSTLRAGKTEFSPIFGYPNGDVQKAEVTGSNLLYVRSGLAIDAVGTELSALIGGNGGALRSPVDLSQVESIEVSSGHYYWGGNHIVALKFKFKNGSSVMSGSKGYASPIKVETFDIPQGKQIKAINAWTAGWLVDAIQLELN